jgi:hypothetical protein
MNGKAFVLFLLMTAIPGTGWSQSTLNFPKFFSAAELPASGFAVVNPGSAAATVNFTLYSATGAQVSTGILAVPAGGQRARSGDQIFTSLGTGGWVQANSTTTGLQGFWLNYASDVSFIDGAEAAATALDQVIPLVAGATEINIANPAAASNDITIALFGEAGTSMGTATASIPPHGVYRSMFSTAFPSVNVANVRYVRVTSAQPAAASAMVRGYLVTTDTAVVNGVNRAGTNTQMNFPHVVSGIGGGGDYTTEVGVTNLSATAQTVSISFTSETGGPATTVTRPLAANGALRAAAKDLFSFNQAEFKNGWIRVSGTAPIAGFVAYADRVAGGVAVVSVQETPRTQLLFAHIADLDPFYTGLAVLNTNSTPASVSVSAMTPDGALIGNGTFTVAAGAKTAKLLLEIVRETQDRTSDGGFLLVSSNVPLYGLELFFNRNLSSLSNVAAGALSAGITYVPPAPPQPLTLTSLSPRTLARGEMLTLAGSGFSATTSNNIVIFASATDGTVEVTASATSPTSLTVKVPMSATSGPVSARVGERLNSGTSPIVDVLATSTTLVQSNVIVTGGASATADIYVTPPVAGLNVTYVGIADVSASYVAFGASSAEVGRGTTKLLLLAGAGISAANGTTITISGSGVTITSAPQFQTDLIIVTINVAANASLGPRNIVVTNSNHDTAVLTGGLFIR